jgi:hypothetical protein
MKLAFNHRDENSNFEISTESPVNSAGRVCEFSIVMLNKTEEELHAKTLTNLGTKSLKRVCEKTKLFLLIN